MNAIDTLSPIDQDMMNMLLEPRPLSDAIHFKHLLYQQKQLGLLFLEKQRLKNDGHPHKTSYPSSISVSRKRRREQRKMNVDFASHVLVHFSPHDLDELECDRLWYTKADLTDFKLERKKIIKALHNCNFDLNNNDRSFYNLRGLEPYRSVSFNKMMQRKRMQVVKSVLVEQARQRNEGISDTESIRSRSCTETEWARERGIRLAKGDEKAVALELNSQPPPTQTVLRPHHQNHRITAQTHHHIRHKL